MARKRCCHCCCHCCRRCSRHTGPEHPALRLRHHCCQCCRRCSHARTRSSACFLVGNKINKILPRWHLAFPFGCPIVFMALGPRAQRQRKKRRRNPEVSNSRSSEETLGIPKCQFPTGSESESESDSESDSRSVNSRQGRSQKRRRKRNRTGVRPPWGVLGDVSFPNPEVSIPGCGVKFGLFFY